MRRSSPPVSELSIEDIELAFYEEFFFSRDMEPYPVQEESFGHIFAGDSVLITVPTGTGKTLMAKAGIFRALKLGRRAIYTTPLRALTEEKYRELCEDFGEDNVGFATGDFKVNRDAPIQVEVAEILWNRIFGDRGRAPADIVIMDEGHYFNDYGRGHVWEQTIIGLHPTSQLVILSATVGHADRFCHWVELTRRSPMRLVESRERKVPLHHEYREDYLIEVVRDLAAHGGVPALVFVFGREMCFEKARLLKSCRRFTTDEERQQIRERCDEVLLDGGVSGELRPLLEHGIGVHHAGILPRYKQLVEELAVQRLVKFIVCTETIAAGINLPAKRVVFPSLRKYVSREARLVTPAEFHQMAGRAGRPQFDTEGIAITLGPEDVVQAVRKEIKDAKKRGRTVDEAKIRKNVYARAESDAKRQGDVTWTAAAHQALVTGEPAELRSKTRITAEQVLTIGLPDLAVHALPDAGDEEQGAASEAASAVEASLPPSLRLDIATVVDNLLLSERERRQARKLLVAVTENLESIGIIDEHGVQVEGQMIRDLNGIDGLFVYFALRNHQFDYDECCEMVEYLVDHHVIQRVLDRKDWEKRKEWIRARLRELRADNPQAAWEDAEEEYDKKFPREPTRIEVIHAEFAAAVKHPELHGGKKPKTVWATMEQEGADFLHFVDTHRLAREEGSLFSYLIRVMKFAETLHGVTSLGEFELLGQRVRKVLATVDARLA